MPEPTTAAILPTTLLLLYFVAPPQDVPKGESKTDLETKTLWTLQSTSRLDFNSPGACKAVGTKMIAETEPVATLTVRAYCICEHGNGNRCPDDTVHSFSAVEMKPTVEALGKPRPPAPAPRPRR